MGVRTPPSAPLTKIGIYAIMGPTYNLIRPVLEHNDISEVDRTMFDIFADPKRGDYFFEGKLQTVVLARNGDKVYFAQSESRDMGYFVWSLTEFEKIGGYARGGLLKRSQREFIQFARGFLSDDAAETWVRTGKTLGDQF